MMRAKVESTRYQVRTVITLQTLTLWQKKHNTIINTHEMTDVTERSRQTTKAYMYVDTF